MAGSILAHNLRLKFCQMCWWNINHNISFLLKLFSRKTSMTKFFKKSNKSYFGLILGLFCPNLGKKKFSWKKELCQFLNIGIIYHCAKNQLNLMNHSWENFRVLQLIEKSHNLIGQTHFGSYLRNQNFTKYETCSYDNTNFHYRPNREKVKELKKQLNFPVHSKNPRFGLFSPFWGQNIIFKKSGWHAQHHIGS